VRVTNKMLSNNYLSDMNTNLQNLKTLQQQMSTGKNFSKPSDDPFNVARSMQMHSQINANTQYNKNITNVINYMDTADTALGQLGNVFQSVREKLVSAGNAAYGSDERQKIKDEINQRVGQVAQILNTSFDGEYIFGGTRGSQKPVEASSGLVTNSSSGKGSGSVTGKFTGTSEKSYDVKIAVDGSGVVSATSSDGTSLSANKGSDGSYSIDLGDGLTLKVTNPSDKDEFTFSSNIVQNTQLVFTASENSEGFNNISSKRKTEISQGVLIDYNVGASDIIKFDGKDKDGNNTSYDIRTILSNITNHLDSKDSADTSKLTNEDLTALDAAMSQILKVRSEVGAKQNRMESAKDQNEQAKLDMTDILSKTEDIDITEKTMEYANMQTVYLAALQTSAKVLQPTLMDYMG
jgi:flagellar hook-associated protein 3